MLTSLALAIALVAAPRYVAIPHSEGMVRFVDAASISLSGSLGAITQISVWAEPRTTPAGIVSLIEIKSQFDCAFRLSRATEIVGYGPEGAVVYTIPVDIPYAPLMDDPGLLEAFDIACNGVGDRPFIDTTRQGLIAAVR